MTKAEILDALYWARQALDNYGVNSTHDALERAEPVIEQALDALRELELWRAEAALAQRDTAHPHARVVAARMQARVCMQLADEGTPF